MIISGVSQQQSRKRTGGATTYTVAPVISGAGYTGLTMSSTDGTWTGAVGGYTYQWQVDLGAGFVDISGATSSTSPVFTVAQEGKPIRCNVTNNSVTVPSNTIHSWIPSDLVNLASWVDYRDTASVTFSGTSITIMNDKSGGVDRKLEQEVAGGQPQNTGTLNGHSAMLFDGGDYLRCKTVLPQGASSMVYIGSAGGKAQQAYFGNHDTYIGIGVSGDGSSNISRVNNANDASGNEFLFDGESSQTIAQTRAALSTAMAASSLCIFSSLSTMDNAEWQVGSAGMSTAYGINGSMGETFSVSGALTLPEKKKIQGYAAWRWNFVSDLGVHDYDSAAPTV